MTNTNKKFYKIMLISTEMANEEPKCEVQCLQVASYSNTQITSIC